MGDLEITTLLSLDRWAQIIGLDPRHFRQITTTAKTINTCTKVWKEHPYQEADAISRDDVTMAIQQAEDQFAEYLGYKVRPDWIVGERHITPQVGDVALYNKYAWDPQGFNLSLPLRFGHIIEGGVKTVTLIEDDVDVVYSDPNSDGYDELATIVFATTVTDPQEIMVVYPDKTMENWEIRPFKTCVISGGSCTITFLRHQFAIESLIESLEPTAIDGDDDANFLAHVDVYRRYSDPTNMCYLIWNAQAGSCSDDCCGETSQTACLVIRDYRMSRVGYQPSSYDPVTEEWTANQLSVCRNPDQIHVCYFAGYRDSRRTYPVIQMDLEFERAISYYALTLLRREVCGCTNVESLINHWTEDLGQRTPGGSSYEVSRSMLDNPLGTTRAAILAWNLINRRLIARTVEY